MAERRAKATERAGLEEQRRLTESGKRLTASQIVGVAAGGGKATGTNLKAIMRSAANIESDAAIISQNTQFQADTERYQGNLARYQGRMARYASRIRAASTIGKNVGMALLMANIGGGAKTPGQAGSATQTGSLYRRASGGMASAAKYRPKTGYGSRSTLGKFGGLGSLSGRSTKGTSGTKTWSGLNTKEHLFSGGTTNA